MGLTERLARFAAGRPRAFIIAAPGGTAARLTAEAELRRRGWPVVRSPLSTGLLVVCGDPGKRLDQAIETVWSDLPNPRAITRIPPYASEQVIAGLFDGAASALADVDAQRSDAADRIAAGPWSPADHAAPSDHDMDMGGHDGHDMGGHGGHDMGGHGGHDMGGHEHHMGAPGGLAMADRGEDRDGLRLDQLHVPLGPVLPYWPAGLVVRTTLQGDVVQTAEVEVAEGRGGEPFWDAPWLAALAGEQVSRGAAERRRAAAHLDSLGRLLALAGWAAAGVRAERLRDDLLAERPAGEVTARFERFSSRVLRSRPLHWMTRDLGFVDQDALPGPAGRGGDVAARMRGWLEETRESLTLLDDHGPLDDAVGPRGPAGRRPSAALVEVLPHLLTGAELAAARLIVAGIDPDLDQLALGAVHA